MPVEIEAKMKVADFTAIRERLQSQSATLVGDAVETNVFFDTDDRSLLTKDHALRLRSIQPAGDGKSKHIITFKGPRLHGPLKSREEKELGVESSRDAVALLETLGFQRTLTFEKRRQTWKLNDCLIELDELPHVGCYVEIEGPRDEVVLATREQLQLGKHPLLKSSYVALMLTWLQEQGQSKRSVKFSS